MIIINSIDYLEQLSSEIQILVKNKCYISALNNTIILLDVMSKLTNFPYNKLKPTDKFINFCNGCLHSKDEIGLTGAELYSIRNFMIHEGKLNINNKESNINSILFYVNDDIIHSSFIDHNTGFANVDVIMIIKLVSDYYNKNKENIKGTLINII